MRRVWLMLALRSALSFGLLIGLAALLKVAGSSSAVSESAAWWLWFATLTNVVTIYLLFRFGRAEGVGLRHLFFASKATWKGDLLWVLLGFAVTGLIAQPPGDWLATLLFGGVETPNGMLLQPLPVAAVYPLLLLMPTTHALSELPVYWGYVAPRLRASGMERWKVILLVGAVLSVQHLFLSFQLDWRYDLWLALKFLPFAVWTGIMIDRRPTVLPYFMGAHLLIDSLLPVMTLIISKGGSLQ